MPIDGKDDRYNYWDAIVSNEQRKNADCTGIIIPISSLTSNNDGTFKIDTILYGENCSLCCKDQFYDEPIIRGAIGTCFAIDGKANNLIITARHVIDVAIELGYVKTINEFVKGYCIMFGYVTGKSITHFPAENIYYLCGEHNNTYSRAYKRPEDDFTILYVDRKIKNRVLLNDDLASVKKNDNTYIPGHPLKMLMKIILESKVKEEKSRISKSGMPCEQYFTVSSDIFMYSSGSPVFHSDSHRLLGMVTASDNGSDFVSVLCTCKKNARDYRVMEKYTSTNYILKIDTIRQFI